MQGRASPATLLPAAAFPPGFLRLPQFLGLPVLGLAAVELDAEEADPRDGGGDAAGEKEGFPRSGGHGGIRSDPQESEEAVRGDAGEDGRRDVQAVKGHSLGNVHGRTPAYGGPAMVPRIGVPTGSAGSPSPGGAARPVRGAGRPAARPARISG